eukprot:5443025-Prymnesium_polylepis.4
MTVNLNTLPKVTKSDEAVASIKECCTKVILFKTLSKASPRAKQALTCGPALSLARSLTPVEKPAVRCPE